MEILGKSNGRLAAVMKMNFCAPVASSQFSGDAAPHPRGRRAFTVRRCLPERRGSIPGSNLLIFHADVLRFRGWLQGAWEPSKRENYFSPMRAQNDNDRQPPATVKLWYGRQQLNASEK